MRNSKLTLKNTVALYQHDEQLLSSQPQGSYRDCLETRTANAMYGTLAKEWKEQVTETHIHDRDLERGNT